MKSSANEAGPRQVRANLASRSSESKTKKTIISRNYEPSNSLCVAFMTNGSAFKISFLLLESILEVMGAAFTPQSARRESG